MIIALSGGVGGAKLSFGLSQVVAPEDLKIIVNTGDDFEHMGLHVSPDIDTVCYTLARIANPKTGWGLVDETWKFMQASERLGGPTWFQLCDQDLATHVLRTERLRLGHRLSDITRDFAQHLGLTCAIIPMSDDPVRTEVESSIGRLKFQDYFVRHHCEPAVTKIIYQGIELALPSDSFTQALSDSRLKLIVFCPSNPFLSLDPILHLLGIAQKVRDSKAKVVAVSPIIGNAAVKGPAAKMLQELGMQVSAFEIARYYQDLLDYIFIDKTDAHLKPLIEALGVKVVVSSILMKDDADRIRLAREVIEHSV